MKLSSKILSFITPLSIVGIVVPTITSCSCGGSSYEINYGDNVNCKDKDGENYHSLEEIQRAIKLKANKEPRHEIYQYELVEIRHSAQTESGTQSLYFDLIASCVLIDKLDINLSNWKTNVQDDFHNFVQFNLNGTQYGSDAEYLGMTYMRNQDDKKIYLSLRNNTEIVYSRLSYVYSDCTFVEA